MKINMLVSISPLMFVPKSKCMHKFVLGYCALFTTWCQIHLLTTFWTRSPITSNILCPDIWPTTVIFAGNFNPIRIKNIVYFYFPYFYTCSFFKYFYTLCYKLLFFSFFRIMIVSTQLRYSKFQMKIEISEKWAHVEKILSSKYNLHHHNLKFRLWTWTIQVMISLTARITTTDGQNYTRLILFKKIVINDQIEWKILMVVKSVENLLIQLENFGFLENWTRCEFHEIRDKPWLYVHYLFRQESNMGLCSSHFQHFPSIDPEHRYLRPSWVSF